MASKPSSADDLVNELDLQKLLGALASAVRSVQGLPSTEEDFEYECSFPEFGGKPIQSTRKVWLQIVESILKQPGLIKNREDLGYGGINENDDIDAQSYDDIDDPLLWDECAEMCELLLEHITELDFADDETDSATVPLSVTASTLQNARNTARSNATSQWNRVQELLVSDLPKPQDIYKHLLPPVPQNARTVPFVPAVHPEKPFGIVPLPLKKIDASNEKEHQQQQQYPTQIQNQIQLNPGHGIETRFESLRSRVDLASIPNDVVAPAEHCPHLYEEEIKSFTYTESQLQIDTSIDLKNPIQVPTTLECLWVDTVPGLEQLAQFITSETCSEIAVDLEAHSFRSFAGFVCLMQITVRIKNCSKNYLIDTLVLEQRHINRVLAPLFANPSIVKVLHGADHDIPWLQRDFGIYVVNLFDTGRAARALKFQSASYAFLLKRYCSETMVVDKTHQLADWRQRPITPAMEQYAIQDTHYLLDIYDRLKVELFDYGGKQMIQDVLDTSRNVCLVRYALDPFKPTGYKVLLNNTNRKLKGKNRNSHKRYSNELNHQQEKVLCMLWDWRDQMARLHDESTQYVCTNPALLRLSLACPTTMTQLQSLFHPMPTILLQHSQNLIDLVKKAKIVAERSQLVAEDDENEGDDDDEDDEEELRVISNNVKAGEEDSVGDEDDEEDVDGPGFPSRQHNASTLSTFFKPADGLRDEDEAPRRGGMMSPVLGTEALYRHAGWVTTHERESESRKSGDRYFLEQQRTSAKDDDDDSTPRNFLSVQAPHNSVSQSQPYLLHNLEVGQQPKIATPGSSERPSRIQNVPGMTTVRIVNNSNKDTTVQDEDALKDHAVDSAKYIENDLKAAVPAVLRLASCTPDATRESSIPVVDDDDGSEDGLQPNKAKGSSELVGVNDDDNFEIPRSIREIYQISNRNRRAKKVGSPTPEDQDVPPIINDREREELRKAEALLKEKGLMDSNGKSYLFDDDTDHKVGSGKRHRGKSGRESEETVVDTAVNAEFDREEDLACKNSHITP